MRVYHTCRHCVICKQYYLARLNFEKAKRHEQLLVGFNVLWNSRGCCVQEKTEGVEECEGIASHRTTDDREKVEGQKEIANDICSVNCEFSIFFVLLSNKMLQYLQDSVKYYIPSKFRYGTYPVASYLATYPSIVEITISQLASLASQASQIDRQIS